MSTPLVKHPKMWPVGLVALAVLQFLEATQVNIPLPYKGKILQNPHVPVIKSSVIVKKYIWLYSIPVFITALTKIIFLAKLVKCVVYLTPTFFKILHSLFTCFVLIICFPIAFHIFSCSLDDEENVVDEGAEDFKPSEPQSKAEARGAFTNLY